MKRKTFIAAIIMILIINLPLWDFFIGENYTYSNRDGSFNYEEMTGKGADFVAVAMNYGRFLALHPEKDQGDNNLYRTFTIKPWRFWEWRQYLLHSDRFALPYLEPKPKN